MTVSTRSWDILALDVVAEMSMKREVLVVLPNVGMLAVYLTLLVSRVPFVVKEVLYPSSIIFFPTASFT